MQNLLRYQVKVEIYCFKYSSNQSIIYDIAFIHLNFKNRFTRPLVMLSQIMLNIKNHEWVSDLQLQHDMIKHKSLSNTYKIFYRKYVN